MPAQGLLQRFHDLAEADDLKRCIAAASVRRSLKAGSDVPGEDLQYILKRLVRGVQSSRACSRQGFSLALAEVLSALPNELPAVLTLIKQLTALQLGLKASEQKERLLGRLFAYAAVLESGCLREALGGKADRGKKPALNAAAEIGSGLAEMYAAKPYLRAPAARLLADLCKSLCAAGLASEVPAAVEKWALDEKMGSSIDVYAAGIILELRLLLEDAEHETPGSAVTVLKTWPSCVRKDAFSQAPTFRHLAQSLADALATTPLGDALPWTLAPFCRWWLRVFKTRDCLALQGELWGALEEKLFPEKASQAALAQGFRGLGQLATQIREASAGSPHAGPLLRGLFEKCPSVLAQLFKSLCYQRSPAHAAAAFGQQLLSEAVGTPEASPAPKNGSASSSAAKPPAVQIDDDARLAILACLQKHKGFSTMKGSYQRLWQQVLLTPLSSQGVRARCISLLGEMQHAAVAHDIGGAGGVRVCTEQLVKLVKHACAPDEVVLAVLCLLLTASYFAPAGGDGSGGYSFGSFAKSAGLSVASRGDDLLVPVLAGAKPEPREPADEQGDEKAGGGKQQQWSVKLWSALAGIQRRPAAERVAAAAGTAGGAEASVQQPIKSFAYHGCLSDGTLWVMRLHEWWDYIAESAPQAPASSPRLSPKSKKRRAEGAGIQCLVQLSDEDKKLRKRSIEVCRRVLNAPEVEGALSSRQRNALCALPLCLALTLLDAKNEEELDVVRENLKEATRFVDELPATAASEKKRAKSEQQRSEILGAVSRMAAELFVESTGLTKEAARNAWRELGTFAAPETVLGLCASVRDIPEDEDEDDEKKAEDDGSEEEGSGPDSEDEKDHAPNSSEAKRAIAMGAAVAAAKARAATGDEDADADEVVLDGDDVWDKLLEDGDEAGGSLLAAFASAGLQGEGAEGRKMSKRQQKLQMRQEEVTRKFGEVELLEVYLKGHGTSDVSNMKPIWVQVLKELYDALLSAGRRHNGNVGKAEDKAKKTKVDAVIRKMESDLISRIAGMLNRTLKQLRSGTIMRQIDKWHSEAEWAEHARTFFEAAQANQTGASGRNGADAGAMLLYWFCSMHRIRSLRSSGSLAAEEASEPSTKGWVLAEELLGRSLADWSTTKKDEEQRWFAAVLGAFACRVPHILLGLPWCETIRACRNSFVQRSLVSMLVSQIFKSPVMKPNAATGKLAADFAGSCCDLLKGAMEDSSKLNKSQRQKMKLQFLSAINATLTVTLQLKPRSPIGGKLAQTMREVLTSSRDSPGITYGKLYSLSNNSLRLLRRQDGSIAAAAAISGGSDTDPQTRRAPSSPTLKRKARPGRVSGDESPRLKRRRGPGDVPAPAADDGASDGGGSSSKGAKRLKAAKGAKNFFAEM